MSPDHEKILWLINNYGAVKIYDCSLLVKKPQVYLERICKDLEEAGKIRVDEGRTARRPIVRCVLRTPCRAAGCEQKLTGARCREMKKSCSFLTNVSFGSCLCGPL